MQLRPEEISAVIKEQIKNYRTKIDMDDVGTCLLYTSRHRQAADHAQQRQPGKENAADVVQGHGNHRQQFQLKSSHLMPPWQPMKKWVRIYTFITVSYTHLVCAGR